MLVFGAGDFARYVLQGALTGVPFSFVLVALMYLPDAVRWAHFFEVGISNFIYGAAIVWLLAPPPRPVAALAGSSA
jgi:hypothetical protein